MEKLKFINSQMSAISIPYEFMRWTSTTIPDLYFVGEITESPVTTEDGKEESTMLLTGFSRGSYADIEIAKERIKSRFSPVCGLRTQTESGSTIVAFFDGYFYVPTGEADLKKIQINLKIYEWKGAI